MKLQCFLNCPRLECLHSLCGDGLTDPGSEGVLAADTGRCGGC